MRGLWANFRASAARSMSRSLQRARPQTVAPVDFGGDGADGLEVARRGDREAGLDDVDAECGQGAGDLHLLGLFMLAPGDCSPSRKVVSKIRMRLVVGHGSEAPRSLRVKGVSGKTESPEIHRRAGLGASYVTREAFGRRTLRPRSAEKAEGQTKSEAQKVSQGRQHGRFGSEGSESFRLHERAPLILRSDPPA